MHIWVVQGKSHVDAGGMAWERLIASSSRDACRVACLGADVALTPRATHFSLISLYVPRSAPPLITTVKEELMKRPLLSYLTITNIVKP